MEDNQKNSRKTQLGNNCAVQSKKIRLVRVLPPVFRVSEREKIRRMIKRAGDSGFSGIMVRTLEELETARRMRYDGEIIADASLYTWNGRAMAAISADCGRIVCSLEMNRAWIEDAAQACAEIREDGVPAADGLILPVYGRVPMMETEGCIRRTENMCSGKDGFWYLEDRMGKKLPVRCRCGNCSNTIYNAVPLSLHQFTGRGLMAKVPVHLCMFTDESAEDTRRILDFFVSAGGKSEKKENSDAGEGNINLKNTGSKGKSGNKKDRTADRKTKDRRNGKAVRDAKTNIEKGNVFPPFEEYTNGHFKTGAI